MSKDKPSGPGPMFNTYFAAGGLKSERQPSVENTENATNVAPDSSAETFVEQRGHLAQWVDKNVADTPSDIEQGSIAS